MKAIRWREDIDMTARTITVNRQVILGQFGTPKGRTRRTIPTPSRSPVRGIGDCFGGNVGVHGTPLGRGDVGQGRWRAT